MTEHIRSTTATSLAHPTLDPVDPRGREGVEQLELTILMPCLNEAETLGTCIDKALAYLADSGVRGEVLIADNGSTDGSQQLARAKGARVVAVPERGYGAALKSGIQAAYGRYIIMGDADDSYDLYHLDRFVEKLREGNDLVMGNRFQGGIAPGAMPSLHRYLGNPVLSYIGRLFFGARIGDFHCGLRGFNRERMSELHLHTSGMEFASEMVISSALRAYRVAEVPTTLKKDGRSRQPHLRTWHDGWRHLRFLLMYSPRWLFIYPGLALMAFGIGTAALMFRAPTEIADGAQPSIYTFLVAAIAILLGVQNVTLGLIAQRFAIRYGFLPAPERPSQILAFLTFERGLIAAVLLASVGIAGFAWSLFAWASVNLAMTDYDTVLRVLIASLTSVAIGVELGFSVFLSGIMSIPGKRDSTLGMVDYRSAGSRTTAVRNAS